MNDVRDTLPGRELVPTGRGGGEPPLYERYRTLFTRLDESHAAVEEAHRRVESARAELDAAERSWNEVESRVHALWWEFRSRLGRRGRGLEALPQPDADALPGLSVAGLLDEAAAEITEDPDVDLAMRVPHGLVMPLSGAVSGAAGFLLARLWLHVLGVNVLGALGLVALVAVPLGGVAVGLRWRGRRAGEVVETDPGPALVGFAFAAVAEIVLRVALR